MQAYRLLHSRIHFRLDLYSVRPLSVKKIQHIIYKRKVVIYQKVEMHQSYQLIKRQHQNLYSEQENAKKVNLNESDKYTTDL